MQPLRLLFKTLVLSVWLGTPTARAQALDPTFAAASVYAPGSVYSVMEQADGKLVAVGNFTRINETAVSRLVRFNADGTLDAAFNQQVGSNAVVYRARPLSNGQYLLVGFDNTPVQAGGLTRPGGLLRLNADGSGDAAFDAGSGPGSTQGDYTSIDDALPLANGQSLVVGVFDRFNGVPASNLVRLNANGSVDAAFRSGAGANDEVLTVVPVANGKVLIGGSFTQYNGFICNGLARLNADGSFDTSFASSLQAGTSITNLTVQPNGRILVAGYLSDLATPGSPTSVIRLLDNGMLDNSFFAPASISSDPGIYSYYGDALAVQNDGRILVMSTPSRPVVRLNPNGTLDQSYVSTTDANYPPYSLTLLRNGQLLEAGPFTNFGGTLDQPLVRLTTTGSVDASFQPIIRMPGTIAALAQQPDGRVVAGGNFSEINGQPARRLARFTPGGTLDAAFSYNTGNTLNLSVSSLALQPNGSVLAASGPALYRYTANGSRDNSFTPPGFTGFITHILLQPDSRILVGGNFNSSTGNPTPKVVRLSSSGSEDPTFVLASTTGSAVPTILYTMALQADGKLLLGGLIRPASGSPALRLIRYSATGTIDPAFKNVNFTNAAGNYIGTRLNALTLQPDGKVLVGGVFTKVGGTGLNNVARLNTDGSLDVGFAPPVITGTVYSLAVQANNRIAVGGSFSSPTVPAQLARLLPNGSPDDSFGATAVPNGGVRVILPQSDGRLLIGGWFTNVGGQNTMALARLVAPSVLHVQAPAAVAEHTTVWPVPAQGQLHVAPAPGAHAQQFELLDALSRPVRRQPLAGPQTATMNLRGLSAGLYLLRVTYAEGIVTRRVQVQ